MTALSLPIKRPLLPVSAVQLVLDCSEDKVLELLQLGELSWAFDVRHRGARRAYLRVCAQSVEDYLGKRSSLGNGEDFNVFFAWFLPCPTNIITGRGASQLLCVSPDHVLGLIDSGCLVGTGARRGPKGSPVVQVESLKAFLQDRRWSG